MQQMHVCAHLSLLPSGDSKFASLEIRVLLPVMLILGYNPKAMLLENNTNVRARRKKFQEPNERTAN